MEDAQLDAALRRILFPIAPTASRVDWVTDKAVLLAISMGLVVILLTIIIGLLLTPRALPNWAENVFVSVATATALKLGDCIGALVALSSGRSVERMGAHLAVTTPVTDAPQRVTVTNPPESPIPVEESRT